MHFARVIERVRSTLAASQLARRSLVARWGRLALAAAVSLLGTAALAGPAAAMPHRHSTHYEFRTIDNAADPTFNQLLGINNFGLIAGYFGSGAQGAPNKGYLLSPNDHQPTYRNEDFPGSVQTQVTGLNDRGITVGFWSDMNNANLVNDNFGFVSFNGLFRTVNFPVTSSSGIANPPVNQLLGVNDRDLAVGFYTDANGANHGYVYDILSNHYHEITISQATSVTAAAINNRDDIAGSDTIGGTTEGFLRSADGHVTPLVYPNAMMTQALGVNDHDEVVGLYQLSDNSTHGFTWTPWQGFRTLDDPHGPGTTTINGVNDSGQLVGFYTDAAGNTDGMLATPHRY